MTKPAPDIEPRGMVIDRDLVERVVHASAKNKRDPDELVDRIAAAILKTRAKGLGREQWARRAAASVLLLLDERGAP